MPIKTEMVEPTRDAVAYVADNMREADRREVWASHTMSPREALAMSIANSDMLFACVIDGVPACITGVVPDGESGIPWLLGTDDLNGRAFFRHSIETINRFHERYSRLWNHVDARHEKSIRWLKSVGFTLEAAHPHGPFGLLFHRFEKCA